MATRKFGLRPNARCRHILNSRPDPIGHLPAQLDARRQPGRDRQGNGADDHARQAVSHQAGDPHGLPAMYQVLGDPPSYVIQKRASAPPRLLPQLQHGTSPEWREARQTTKR